MPPIAPSTFTTTRLPLLMIQRASDRLDTRPISCLQRTITLPTALVTNTPGLTSLRRRKPEVDPSDINRGAK